MPIIQSLMDKLVKQYGPERGKRVYYAMEAEGKGPFAKGAKHRDKHEAWAAKNGVEPTGDKKKPPAPKKSGASARTTGRSRSRRTR